jgi:glycosyltransferase involved in cell wall biosynthesis
MSEMITKKPLFSIGVTTYNRKGLLKQTLLSLLEQTFTDFEVIVGNDHVNEPLSEKVLGIKDSRLKFVNNEKNLGELENMNSLLRMAQGRYFTWQFDDDPVSPAFLQQIYSTLIKFSFPTCVFTSYLYIYGISAYKFRNKTSEQSKLFSGKNFLREYLSGKLHTMGCCGLYNTDYLKQIGGVQRLTEGPMALYTENLLLVKVGLLPEVAYINMPLVSYRVHRNSWTCLNNDVELFKVAGLNLIRESVAILSKAQLKNDFQKNILSILEFVLSSVVVKSIIRNKRIDNQYILEYVSSIGKEFEPLKGSEQYQFALFGLERALKNVPIYIFKTKIKMLIPPRFLKFVHMARSIFLPYINKIFN